MRYYNDRAARNVAANSGLSLGRAEGLACIAVVALSTLLPQGKQLPKLCLVNRATGLPCPACGLTRSFGAVGHGDWRGATRYHLLGVPTYMFALTVGIWTLVRGRLRISLTPQRVVGMACVLLAAWAAKVLFVPRRYW